MILDRSDYCNDCEPSALVQSFQLSAVSSQLSRLMPRNRGKLDERMAVKCTIFPVQAGGMRASDQAAR